MPGASLLCIVVVFLICIGAAREFESPIFTFKRRNP